jgi:hypothetical protein
MFRALLYDHPQGSSFVLSALPLLRLFCFVQLLIRYVAVCCLCVFVCVCPTYVGHTHTYTNHIFSHRIVLWVYIYMFRPYILVIVRLCCKLNKELYNICAGYCGGNGISSYNSGWHGFGPLWTFVDIQVPI